MPADIHFGVADVISPEVLIDLPPPTQQRFHM